MGRFSLVKKEAEYKISEENALAAVLDLIGYYDIDVDRVPEGKEGEMAKAAMERSLEQLVDYVRRGVIEIHRGENSSMEVIHHLHSGKELVYKEVTAQAKLAMDKYKQTESYNRMYALMGTLCGFGKGVIEKLPAKDLAVVEILGAVFSNA